MVTNQFVSVDNNTFALNELASKIQLVLTDGVPSLAVTGTASFGSGTTLGKLRYNADIGAMQYSNDNGTTWSNLNSDTFWWNAYTAYAADAVVLHGTGWWRCVTANTGATPGTSNKWALLTSGSIVRYATNNEQLTAALQSTGTAVTIVLKGNVLGNVTATATATTITLYSDETSTFSGNINLTLPTGGNLYWHANGSLMTAAGNTTIAVSGGTLWVDRLTASVGAITFSGNVKYQRVNGTVSGGTQDSWLDTTSQDKVPKDLTALPQIPYNDTGRLYVDNGISNRGWMSIANFRTDVATEAVSYFQIHGQGTLDNRPQQGEFYGYIYYATDNGNIYVWLHSNQWSTGVRIKGDTGPAGATGAAGADGINGWTVVPSISESGSLTWTAVLSSAQPAVPSAFNIKGSNGYTVYPTLSSAGVLSWTATQTQTPPVPPDPMTIKGTDGQNGYTVAPSIDASGYLSWTVSRPDTAPVAPETMKIKGTDGQNGYTVVPTINSSGYLSWTVSRPSGAPTPPETLKITGDSAFEIWKEEYGTPTSTIDDFMDAMGVGSRLMSFTNAQVVSETITFDSKYPVICVVDNTFHNWSIPTSKVVYDQTNSKVTVNLDYIYEQLGISPQSAAIQLASGWYERYSSGDTTISGTVWYAWKKDAIVVYTASATPVIADLAYAVPGETAGVSWQINNIRAERAEGQLPGTWYCAFGGGCGRDGKSAYQIWLDAGHTGTEQDFLDSLVGGSFPDVNNDGRYYARINKSWSDITSLVQYTHVYTKTQADALLAPKMEAVSLLPLASEAKLGLVYHLAGAQQGYVKGHQYKCVFDGTNYSWSDIGITVDALPTQYSTNVITSGAVYTAVEGKMDEPGGTRTNGYFLKVTDAQGTLGWAQVGWSDVQNKPTTFTPAAHTHVTADITDLPNSLITVKQGGVVKGSFTLNQTTDYTLELDAGGGGGGGSVNDVAVNGVSVVSNHVASITISQAGLSGDYDDLTNKPTIPTVNDPTITFTQGGSVKGSITLNQSGNATIAFDAGGGGGSVDDVTVNGTSVVTGGVAGIVVAPVALSGSYNDLTDKPVISGDSSDYTAFEVMANDAVIPAGTATGVGEAVTAVAIPVGMTEKFTAWMLETGKLTVSWGDGTVEELDVTTTASTTACEHTYAAAGKYIIKVYGSKFCRLAHTADNNLLSRCLEDDLPLASRHNNLQNFAKGSLRLFKIDAPAWIQHSFIASMANTFNGCSNLISVTGLSRLASIGSCVSVFQSCISMTTCQFRLPALATIGTYDETSGKYTNDGYRYAFYGCHNLQADLDDILPSFGFSSDIVDLAGILTHRTAGTTLQGITMTRPTIVAQKLWFSGKAFYEYSSFASDFSDAVRAQIPTSWGGTSAEIEAQVVKFNAEKAVAADLATVATSGSYNDLSNKPTIPTVNDSTITLTQGGVTKGSFTLNQAEAGTIELDAGGGGGTSIKSLQLTRPVSDSVLYIVLEGSTDGTTFTSLLDGRPRGAGTIKFYLYAFNGLTFDQLLIRGGVSSVYASMPLILTEESSSSQLSLYPYIRYRWVTATAGEEGDWHGSLTPSVRIDKLATSSEVNSLVSTAVSTHNSSSVAHFSLFQSKLPTTGGESATIIRNSLTEISGATTEKSLTDGNSYTHTPTAAVTYWLPPITGSTSTHEIQLDVDMANTASIAFKVYGGTTIEVKTSLIPEVGDKWSYYCTWKFGGWQVFGVRIVMAE